MFLISSIGFRSSTLSSGGEVFINMICRDAFLIGSCNTIYIYCFLSTNFNIIEKCTTTYDDQNDDDTAQAEKTSCSKIKKRTKARIIRSVWFNKEADPE